MILFWCAAFAQPTTPQQIDPLVALMMSQPSIITTGAVRVIADFDPPAVSVGDLVVYRLTLVAIQDSIELPETLPFPPQLEMREGAQGNILIPAGTNIEARTTFIYRGRPSQTGAFTVPAFDVNVYGRPARVPPTALNVLPKGAGRTGTAQTLHLEVSTTNAVAGQAVRAKVMLPFGMPASQSLSQVQLTGAEGQGFLVDQTSVRQRIEPVSINGSNQITYIYETLVTPISSGRISFYAHGWTTTSRSTGLVYITNGMVMNLVTTYTLLDSEPVEINVKPVPAEGQLPGYTGAIGAVTHDPPVLSTNLVQAGDPIKMRVTFRSDGNIARLVPPPAPKADDWQIFEASGDPTAPQMIHAQGAITFTYTLIPLTTSIRQTPPLPFSYFEPRTGRYVDATIKPVSVSVVPATTEIDVAAIAAANASTPARERRLTLSGLAPTPGFAASLQPLQRRSWFPVVQVAPALFFGGLFLWHKRRRYFLAYPGFLLRTLGLRNLQKQRKLMNHAKAAGDSEAFRAAAVQALREGAYPHFPALPRALVCADVLSVLTADHQSGAAGRAVKALFEELDQKFALNARERPDVFSLHEPLLTALSVLENKLRQSIAEFPSWLRLKAQTVLVGGCLLCGTSNAVADDGFLGLWQNGTNAYAAGDFATAARSFREAAAQKPTSGTLQNLGLAEWQAGNTGPAVLAWEQAIWIDPFQKRAQQNLAFARRAAQLSSPDYAWYEVPSRWLPVNWWPWFTGAGLWLAVGAILLPGVLGERRAAWQQTVAALGFTIFLICIPAQVGVHTLAKIGFVLQKDTALRLTATSRAQVTARIAAGEPVRAIRQRGNFVLVRAGSFTGWLMRKDFAFVAESPNAVQSPATKPHQSTTTVGQTGNLPHSAP